MKTKEEIIQWYRDNGYYEVLVREVEKQNDMPFEDFMKHVAADGLVPYYAIAWIDAELGPIYLGKVYDKFKEWYYNKETDLEHQICKESDKTEADLEQPKHKESYNPKSALEKQPVGSYYTDMPLQPIEFIMKNNIPFPEGNIIKYICRHRNKNKAEDIKKVIHYARILLEIEYNIKSNIEYER